MTSFTDTFIEWCIVNLNIVSDSGHEMPERATFNHLTKGNISKIWKYVIDNVRSRVVVDRIKLALLKKRMIEKLEEAPPSNVYVCIEVETKKIKIANERKKYLEQSVVDMQSRIEHCDRDLTRIQQDIVRVKNMHSILGVFELQCREKTQQNNAVHESIVAVLMSLKRFRKNVESSYNFLTCDESLNVNFANIDDVLHSLKSILKTFENNLTFSKTSVKDQYCQIRKDFDDILDKKQFIDVLFPLEEKAQKNLISFKDANNQLSVQDDETTKTTTNQTEQLIKDLKFTHIKETFETISISKLVKTSSQNKQKILVNPYTKSGLGCTTSYSLQIELFQKLSEEKGLIKSTHYLEAILSQLENDSKKVLIQAGSDGKDCQEIESVMQDTYNRIDLIHWLLIENFKGFDSVLSKHQHLLNIMKNVFINVPIIIEETANVEKICNSDKELLWAYSLKTNLFKPVVKEIKLHETVPNERFFQALGVHTMASVDSFLGKCLFLDHGIRNQKTLKSEYFANEHKAKDFIEEIMLSETFFSDLQKFSQQIKLDIEKGKETCLNSELKCNEINSTLNEWWNQDAQFICNLGAEGSSLKVWLNVLNGLPES